MADESPPRTIQQAVEELIKHCEELGLPRLRVAQQVLGYAVKVMKKEGFELAKLLADVTRHWGHVQEKN